MRNCPAPLIFVPAFPLGRVAAVAALGGLEIPHGQQQSQVVPPNPHHDGTKQDRSCSHSRSLVNLWAAPRLSPAVERAKLFFCKTNDTSASIIKICHTDRLCTLILTSEHTWLDMILDNMPATPTTQHHIPINVLLPVTKSLTNNKGTFESFAPGQVSLKKCCFSGRAISYRWRCLGSVCTFCLMVL